MRAALCGAVLVFVPGVLEPFMPAKAALLRLLGLPLLAWSLLGWDADRRSPLGTGAMRPLDLAVLAWVLASVLATITSVAPHLSLLGEIEQREGVLTTLALAGLYAGARRTHADEATRTATLAWLLSACTLAALYALLQLAHADPLQWEGAALYNAGALTVLRPGSTLGNANLLGALLAAAVALGVALLARSDRHIAWRAPALVASAVVTVATLSRGAWVAAAVGVLAALAPVLRAQDARARARAGRALALAAVPAAAWALFSGRTSVLARIAESSSALATSLPTRAVIARAALAIAHRYPWTGGGPDTFALIFAGAAGTAGASVGVPMHAHAVPLQILATLGVVGVLAGAIWCVLLVRTLAAREAARERALLVPPLLALGVAGSVNVLGLAGAAVFVVLSALAACAAEPQASLTAESARPASRVRHVALMLSALLAAVALVQIVPEQMALREAAWTRAALEASVTRDPAQRAAAHVAALAHSARMVARPPADDELWRWRASALLAAASDPKSPRARLLAEAAAAAANACALAPGRPENVRCLRDARALLAREREAQ